jgi:hypothetical protein
MYTADRTIEEYMKDNAQNQLLESERVKEKFVISNKICGIINFNFKIIKTLTYWWEFFLKCFLCSYFKIFLMIDYLIVGSGLAISFAVGNGKSIFE